MKMLTAASPEGRLFWQLLSEVLTNFRQVSAKHRYGASLDSVAFAGPSPCSHRTSASLIAQ